MFVASGCVIGDGNDDVLIIHGLHVAYGDRFVYRTTRQNTFVVLVGKQALMKTVT